MATETRQDTRKNAHPKYYSLTDLERKTMDYLRDIGWYNYECEPGYSDVAPFEIAEHIGVTEQQIGGVLTNLTKKNLLFVEDLGKGCDSQYRHIVYSTGWAYALFGDEDLYHELAWWDYAGNKERDSTFTEYYQNKWFKDGDH